MIDRMHAPLEQSPQVAGPAPKFGSFFVRAIWMISVSALGIFLIVLSSGNVRLSQSGDEIVSTLVFTVLISLPSIFLLTKVSIACTNRFPRLIILIQALVLICTSTAGTFAGVFVLSVVGIDHGDYLTLVARELPFCVVIALLFGLSISTFETLRYKLQAATLELRTRQVEQERANKLLAEARLSSLESAIHPHFLFNTLNSIAALIPSDPARAEQTVTSLASLLRFSLNAQHSGLVRLGQEVKIVRDYLEIEKTRFGARLRYTIEVPEALADTKISPLALQTLAENAVKHVVSKREQVASLQIKGSIAANRICLAVLDDGPGFTLESIAPDHGLGNLIARMEILYGGSGMLEVNRENNQTVVQLSFPA